MGKYSLSSIMSGFHSITLLYIVLVYFKNDIKLVALSMHMEQIINYRFENNKNNKNTCHS